MTVSHKRGQSALMSKSEQWSIAAMYSNYCISTLTHTHAHVCFFTFRMREREQQKRETEEREAALVS